MVTVITPMVVKVAGITAWIHHTQVKKEATDTATCYRMDCLLEYGPTEIKVLLGPSPFHSLTFFVLLSLMFV